MKKHLIGPQRKPTWDRPALQTPGVEILRSTERPTLSATFGESVPPAGLSGWIRRMAYRYSENKFRHWLPLLVADRVNVWEGLAEDLIGAFYVHAPQKRTELIVSTGIFNTVKIIHKNCIFSEFSHKK